MTMLDKIYCAEEQRQRADKALRLNGFNNEHNFKFDVKPTLRIKRLSSIPRPKIKAASTLQRQLMDLERIKAEKALRLNI
jgi:hypothetical protein